MQALIGGWRFVRQRKQRRNRARLEQKNLTGGINCPLDILGCSIMRFDLCSKLCQRTELGIREAGSGGLPWLLDAPRPTAGDCLDDHPLVAQAALDDFTSRGSDHEMVGI